MTRGRRTRLGAAGLAVALCLVGTVGCSSDGGGGSGTGGRNGDRTTTTTKAALEAYCTSALGFATVEPPELDTAAPEAEQAKQRQQYATATLEPAVGDLVDNAPAELEADADVVAAAIDELARSGNPEAYDNDTVDQARGRMHDFDVAHCDVVSEPVTMADFSFSAIEGLEAGSISFDASNVGVEYHELAIVVKKAGVTRSFAEILAMTDPAEQQRYATYVGGIEPVAPGGQGFTIVDLRSGEYLAACFLAVGSTPEPFEAGAQINGAPHVSLGMAREFRVSEN